MPLLTLLYSLASIGLISSVILLYSSKGILSGPGHSRRSSAYIHLKTEQINKIGDLVEALALCHTVSPIYDQENNLSYQPSSPDEGAIIEWTRKVGLTLVGRDPSKRTN